jgi:hypothetical protein
MTALSDGLAAVVSLGLGLEFVSDLPASEGLCSRMTGGCVVEVGVGSGGGCDCEGRFVVIVALRRLLGWPLEYCECCEGSDR